MIRCSGLVLGAVVAFVPAIAGAQAPKEKIVVSLSVDACVAVEMPEVRRLFRLELATSLPNAVEGDAKGAIQVTAACKGEVVELRVIDSLTAKVLVRRIDLGKKGRERLLALAIMELLVASWVELAATPRPKVPPVGKRAGPDARKDAGAFLRKRFQRKSWKISTTLRGGVTMGSIGPANGGALSVNLDAPNGFGWGIDMSVERASDDLALGEVSISTFSASVSAHAHRLWSGFRVRAAVGARVGGVTMLGKPSEPNVVGRSLTGLAAGPFVRVSASKPIFAKVLVGLWLEPGYHVFPVHGLVNGSEQTSVENVWFSARLGVGWQW